MTLLVEKSQELTTAVEQEASKVGLRMNSDKSRVMISGDWEGRSDINASGATIETVEDFCYLGIVTRKSGYELAKYQPSFQSYPKYGRVRKSVYR